MAPEEPLAEKNAVVGEAGIISETEPGTVAV
jgi:hypothetical protein